jgi:hypothetical protein
MVSFAAAVSFAAFLVEIGDEAQNGRPRRSNGELKEECAIPATISFFSRTAQAVNVSNKYNFSTLSARPG